MLSALLRDLVWITTAGLITMVSLLIGLYIADGAESLYLTFDQHRRWIFGLCWLVGLVIPLFVISKRSWYGLSSAFARGGDVLAHGCVLAVLGGGPRIPTGDRVHGLPNG